MCDILNHDISQHFTKGIQSDAYKKHSLIAKRVVSVLFDVATIEKIKLKDIPIISLLNNREQLNCLYRVTIGFIYVEFSESNKRKYEIARACSRFFQSMAEQGGLHISEIKLSSRTLSPNADCCVDEFNQAVLLNMERVQFYNGWQVANKENTQHELYLATVYSAYGAKFTEALHLALIEFARKEGKETLGQKLVALHQFLDSLLSLTPSIGDFERAMNSTQCHQTVALIYNHQLINAIEADYDIKNFHKKWKTQVTLIYDVLVGFNIIEQPLIELFAPEFKSSGSSGVNTEIGDNGNAFKINLLTPVPLSYTDEQAKKSIFDSIARDIQHIQYLCEREVHKTMCRFERFKEFAAKGQVKEPEKTITVIPNKRTGVGGSFNPVSMDNPQNVCATFNQYRFDSPVKKDSYLSFLGYPGRADELSRLLCLPSISLIYPFIVLLVEQHPKITGSWLTNWQLYDSRGLKHGFKQSKGVWVAISYKKRKGNKQAEQTVILNDKSKYIVECIVALTRLSREYLKGLGDDNYRYMLLTVKGVSSKPCRISKIINPSDKVAPSNLTNIFCHESYWLPKIRKISHCDQGIPVIERYRSQVNRTKKQAIELLSCMTLQRFRASVGVRVYFETQSVHAMSEALGHERYKPALLNHYLPKPLWDYFTNRWVRIFQNAIVYEAMQDSDYLFDAVDFDSSELEVFVENHSIGDLHSALNKGKHKGSILDDDRFVPSSSSDEVIFTISTALLQVFIAFNELLENFNPKWRLTPTAEKWVEPTQFVLSHISLSLEKNKKSGSHYSMNIQRDVFEMYNKAKKKPIPVQAIQKAVLC